MIIHKSLTLDGFLRIAHRVFETMGPGRKEQHYQRCLHIELHQMGIPTATEDPVPVFFRGEMVWQGRADLVINKCCVELKANNRPLIHASEQLQDYIREKNKILLLQMGIKEPFSRDVSSPSSSAPSSLFWGLVINFNPIKRNVEHLVMLQQGVIHPLKMITAPSDNKGARVAALESSKKKEDKGTDIIGKNVQYRGRLAKVTGVEILEGGRERLCKVAFKESPKPKVAFKDAP